LWWWVFPMSDCLFGFFTRRWEAHGREEWRRGEEWSAGKDRIGQDGQLLLLLLYIVYSLSLSLARAAS
jgi:hypothetical protein